MERHPTNIMAKKKKILRQWGQNLNPKKGGKKIELQKGGERSPSMPTLVHIGSTFLTIQI